MTHLLMQEHDILECEDFSYSEDIYADEDNGGYQPIYQVDDRVRYQYKGTVDYGTVVEKNGSVFTSYGDVRVIWDYNGLEQNADPKHLTLIEREYAQD